MVEAPERIWLSAADDDSEREVWTDPDEGGTEYTRADIAERQNAELRAKHDRACKECFETTTKLVAAEAENARLRALPLKDEVERVLEKMAQGWANVLELDLIPKQHRMSASILRDDARASLSRLRAGEQEAVVLSDENAVEDAAKAAFIKAQSVYRGLHDHLPLKNTWETLTERIRDGWRAIAYSALEAAVIPPLGTQPEPRKTRSIFVHPRWRPMSDAPKDGAKILYITKFDDIGFCHWDEGYNDDDYPCWWDNERDDEVCPIAWLPADRLPASPSVSEGESRP